MATLPGGVLNNPRWQAFDADGEPLAGALLYSYTTGGTFSTPQALYTDVDLTIAHANPVVADADGRFAEMFLSPLGYDLRLKDSAGTTIWSALDVEDVGQTFLNDLGVTFADGAKDVNTGYTILATDQLVTLDAGEATNPAIINLQPAADRGLPIGIKNLAPVQISVTPDGTETIEGIQAAFTIPVAASPTFPTVWLVSDGVSGYWILSSHGL